MVVSVFRFTAVDLAAFRILSADHNPLHSDPDYAARTPYGRIVVFGVCAVLRAIGVWSEGRSLRLRSLRAIFRKALFVGVDYSLVATTRGDRTTLQITRGGAVQADIVLDIERSTVERQSVDRPTFQPLVNPEVRDAATVADVPSTFDYAIDESRLQLVEALGIHPGQLPPEQLAALAGSSYFVGMISPGERALFAELNIVFDSADAAVARMRCTELTADFDARYQRASYQARLGDVGTWRITAFLRPPPVLHSLAEIASEVGRSSRLAGGTALVTGASRGFGAVFARALALHGARVVIGVRRLDEHGARVLADLDACGGGVALSVDLSDDSAEDELRERLASEGIVPDILVCNAVPVIEARVASEWSLTETLAFIASSVKMTLAPVRAIVPLMRDGGHVVMISSEFVRRPVPTMAHYIAAKSAVEGYARGVAEERAELAFSIARLPRLRTDQTNVPYDPNPGRPAPRVAKELLDRMFARPSSRGAMVFDWNDAASPV